MRPDPAIVIGAGFVLFFVAVFAWIHMSRVSDCTTICETRGSHMTSVTS